MNFPNDGDSSTPPQNSYSELLYQFAASAGILPENEYPIDLPPTPTQRMNPIMPQPLSVTQVSTSIPPIPQLSHII
jgi:hypothetical protein